ncbi:MAG: NIPSNAP family protein [Acidobacteriota bacterium]|nr:NIPSNAP family protein [Acidobacteriota bacterium]
MNRRDVLKTGLAAGVAGAANAPAFSNALGTAEGNHFYELRTYQLRNDIQPTRINEFFQNIFVPMMKKQGIGPVGCFNVISGQASPALIVVTDYKSLAEMQTTMDAMRSDKDFAKAWGAFETTGDMPYVRYESTVLKAFDTHPKTEVPPTEEKRPARIFELRTYESRNAFSLRNKVEMFNQEEIKIFRASGFAPIFFGEGVVGTRLPSLTYLIGFDNMAARDKAWATFVASPDWVRVKTRPGWTDAEAVSNIHASFLRPTNYSHIR